MDDLQGHAYRIIITENPDKPARQEVGVCGSKKVFQLKEPTSCLDCFKSIPKGSLITLEKGISGAFIPKCFMTTAIDLSEITFTDSVEPCSGESCPCPGLESQTKTLEYAEMLGKMV